MKNVLTVMNEDSGQEARLQAALDLTRTLDGHLICLDVLPLPPAQADFTGETATLFMQESEVAAERNRARIEARLGHENVSWEWQSGLGDLVRCTVEAAELADIIVLNRKLESFPFPDAGELAASTAIRSGKPVVAVPEEARGFSTDGTAVVAWDGSAAAAAALSLSVPLLQLAASVLLFTVRTGRIEITAEEGAEYLSRHGIHPEISYQTGTKDQIDALILRECARVGAGYCVMGTYGHSRIAERLFGGVTRRMLTESNVPLVLGR